MADDLPSKEALRRALEKRSPPWTGDLLVRLGKRLSEAGRTDEAEQMFRDAIAKGDQSSIGYGSFALAQLLAQVGRDKEALQACRVAVAQDDRFLEGIANIGLAELFSKLELPGEAESAYRAAMTTEDVEIRARAAVGLADLFESEARQMEEAESLLRGVFESDSKFWPNVAAVRLGRLLSARHRLREAVALFEKAARSGDPASAPEAWYRWGDVLLTEGRLDEAAARFRRAADSGSSSFRSMATDKLKQLRTPLAKVIAETQPRVSGKTELSGRTSPAGGFRTENSLVQPSARTAGVTSGTSRSKKAESLIGRARRLAQEGRADDAEEAYRAVIATGEPIDVPLAQFALSRLLASQGNRLDEAEALSRSAIASGYREPPRVLLLIGEIYAMQGRFLEAEQVYREAMKSPGFSVGASVGLGKVFAASKRLAEAEALFRRAIDAGGDVSDWARLNLGHLLVTHGQLVEAEVLFRRAMESGNRNNANGAVAALADLLQGEGRSEESEKLHRQIIFGPGDSATVTHSMLALGTILESRNRPADFEQVMRKLIESGHHSDLHGLAWAGIGVALARQGNLDQAAPAFRRAAELGGAEVALAAFAALEEIKREND